MFPSNLSLHTSNIFRLGNSFAKSMRYRCGIVGRVPKGGPIHIFIDVVLLLRHSSMMKSSSLRCGFVKTPMAPFQSEESVAIRLSRVETLKRTFWMK